MSNIFLSQQSLDMTSETISCFQNFQISKAVLWYHTTKLNVNPENNENLFWKNVWKQPTDNRIINLILSLKSFDKARNINFVYLFIDNSGSNSNCYIISILHKCHIISNKSYKLNRVNILFTKMFIIFTVSSKCSTIISSKCQRNLIFILSYLTSQVTMETCRDSNRSIFSKTQDHQQECMLKKSMKTLLKVYYLLTSYILNGGIKIAGGNRCSARVFSAPTCGLRNPMITSSPISIGMLTSAQCKKITCAEVR